MFTIKLTPVLHHKLRINIRPSMSYCRRKEDFFSFVVGEDKGMGKAKKRQIGEAENNQASDHRGSNVDVATHYGA